MTEILLSERARDRLTDLDSGVRDRIKDALRDLDPGRDLSRLSGEAFEGTETPDVDDSLRAFETQAFGRLSAMAI